MNNPDHELYQGKYRVQSTRLSGWDYRRNAYYFVTICVNKRSPAFGFVENKKMIFNELGAFADQSIQGIHQHKKNVTILNYVVVPNHVHILLFLNNYLESKKTNKFGPLIPGSLSSLINHFKGRVTKFATNNSLAWPGWQERFDERIVKNENTLNIINQYINNNPAVWANDEYFKGRQL
jgi:REP element-mobilizing transposase RayT